MKRKSCLLLLLFFFLFPAASESSFAGEIRAQAEITEPGPGHEGSASGSEAAVSAEAALAENPGGESASEEKSIRDAQTDFLWNDELEEFWNVVSETEIPRGEKKYWVNRLFELDRERAYGYFEENIYDFFEDKELLAVINEVCPAFGFPAIVTHDKAEIREDLSRFLSWKNLLFVLSRHRIVRHLKRCKT